MFLPDRIQVFFLYSYEKRSRKKSHIAWMWE